MKDCCLGFWVCVDIAFDCCLMNIVLAEQFSLYASVQFEILICVRIFDTRVDWCGSCEDAIYFIAIKFIITRKYSEPRLNNDTVNTISRV